MSSVPLHKKRTGFEARTLMSKAGQMKALFAQLCPTLWNPIDCSPPGSSVHGILQARNPEWVAIYFSSGYSQRRDQTLISCIAGRCFTVWATREVLSSAIKKLGNLEYMRVFSWDLVSSSVSWEAWTFKSPTSSALLQTDHVMPKKTLSTQLGQGPFVNG